ncbi:MAG: hypothetical protein HY080_12710 [Gammaproteobacteria bacterium]|nr:hypothetical protein [Gammaproteobacteria bacterium]
MADTLSADISTVLRSTRAWVRFAGTLFFASAVLSLFSTIDAVMDQHLLTLPQTSEQELHMTAALGVVNVIFESLLGYCLFVYASRVGLYLHSGQPSELESALNVNRQYWKTAGIYAVVFIAVMLLMMVYVVMAMLASSQGTT